MVTDELKMSQILSGGGEVGTIHGLLFEIQTWERLPPSPQEGLHYGQVKMKCLNRWINQQ